MSTPQDPEAVVLSEGREPQPVLSIRATVRVDELPERQGESLRELWTSMETRGVSASGPPFVRYHMFAETETDVEVGIPVAAAASADGRIAAGELPGGAAISTWHIGAHDRLGEAYGRLQAWLSEQDRKPAGAAWEVYWWIDATQEPDPSAWPDATEWRTELVQPIA